MTQKLAKYFFFFFNDPAPTEIYPLPLHDALPIYPKGKNAFYHKIGLYRDRLKQPMTDRKSTRLNSSHSQISYAVFCLKTKSYKLPIYFGRIDGTKVNQKYRDSPGR